MPEFLTLLPPDEAREKLFSHLPQPQPATEVIDVVASLGRILAEDIAAPHPLPDFRRSTVDGFAVRAKDTYGASDSLPAYLALIGEVPMGDAPKSALQAGQCMTIHTGGMLPEGADAVVMLEFTQTSGLGSDVDEKIEVEILKSVAEGENLIAVGEDVAQGQTVQAKGSLMRPAEIGGLMALGITRVRVSRKVRVGLISSGDEVIPPFESPRPGQVRDVNSYTLGALVEKAGGQPVYYGIVGDSFKKLKATAAQALSECDAVIITAGSSASTRDMTADVIDQLGEPGVLVHGVNTRPGKPTILGVCAEKAVIGLPGNPVSALVNGYMLVVPLIERLLGKTPRLKATVQAKLTVNLPSQAGREDWWPVRLGSSSGREGRNEDIQYLAEPIFGKSNLIFTLAAADGLLKIPPDATGLSAGETVEVLLI
ncbi:MAG: molybdopterin molybdotransferase MoeA [Anaerolineales bacterium]